MKCCDVDRALTTSLQHQESGNRLPAGRQAVPAEFLPNNYSFEAAVGAQLSSCEHICTPDRMLLCVGPLQLAPSPRQADELCCAHLTDYCYVQGPYDWHPAPGKLKDACRRAAQTCSSSGVSLRKLALQDSVKNTDLATQLVGMGSVQEVCRSCLLCHGFATTAAVCVQWQDRICFAMLNISALCGLCMSFKSAGQVGPARKIGCRSS